VTGFTNVEDSLGGKWLELLREIDPAVERVAVIFDPKTSQAVARTMSGRSTKPPPPCI